MNQKELSTGGGQIPFKVEGDKNLVLKKGKVGLGSDMEFNFDRVFQEDINQPEIFDIVAKPTVKSLLDGFNGTIMAYGQTASGKTHTMEGTPEHRGIIPRVVDMVFASIDESPETIEFELKVSIMEIYMEEIKDLLDTNNKSLKLRSEKTGGTYVENLTTAYVGSPEEIRNIINIGNQNRTVGRTNMNETSSRSHLIVSIELTQTNNIDSTVKKGRLLLVDLAGSEKLHKTGAEGVSFDEGKKINKSLLALGQVIVALNENRYVPYRDSKLTRLLEQSLGGNSKTSLIIACSPAMYNEQETISTLRFGSRAQKIQNKPVINREYTTEQLLKIVEELNAKISQKNKRIQFLESILKEKVPNFNIIDALANAKDDMMEDMDQIDLKVKLETAQAKILQLENYITNASSSSTSLQITPKKNVHKSLENIEGVDMLKMSPLTITGSIQKLEPGECVTEIVKKRLLEIDSIPAAVAHDLTTAVERLEVENHSLIGKFSKLKAKFTSLITEFKKTTVRDLQSLENVHKTLINKAVQDDKEDASALNVDLVKILSFLHIDNRRLKLELKSTKKEFNEKQEEWADQREKLRDNLDTYGDKVERLQNILNKFLILHNRELDPIAGFKSTASGARALDWKTFTDSLTTKEDEEGSLIMPEVSHDFMFNNTKKTIKGNKKQGRK